MRYDVFVLTGPSPGTPQLACAAIGIREVVRAIKNLDGNCLRFEVKPSQTRESGTRRRIPDVIW